MAETTKDSFIRWQGRTIEQMGFLINTLLVLSTAIIGFSLSYLLQECLPSGIKAFILIGSLIMVCNTGLLLYLSIIRLINFRNTAQIARKREKGMTEGIKELRVQVKKTGKCTWILLDYSVLSFALGVLFIFIGFAIIILSN